MSKSICVCMSVCACICVSINAYCVGVGVNLTCVIFVCGNICIYVLVSRMYMVRVG